MAKRSQGEPERLGDVLASLMRRRTYARPLERAGVQEAWLKAANTNEGDEDIKAFLGFQPPLTLGIINSLEDQ